MCRAIDNRECPMSTTITESLTELFHLVKSLIPENQKIASVSPNTTVANAIAIMNANRYSLLPVIEGKAVLGVFSYRSFASRLLDMGRLKEFPGDLPVDEFVEPLAFVQPFDNWERILNHLDADDAVFVGGHNDLKGLVTTADVLNYLRQVASPFVLLAEIETSLRRAIQACVTKEQLRRCAINGLKSKYGSEDAIPTELTEMDFNDYAHIIGSRENWLYFSPLFGEGDWARRSTTSKLTSIRGLRNDIFHFKRKLEQKDMDQLANFRDWLQRKARGFEERRRDSPSSPSKPIPEVKHKQTGRAHREILRYQFWKGLLEKAKERTPLHSRISPSHDNWIAAGSGLGGVSYNYVILMGGARIELYIDRQDADENRRIFDMLLRHREQVEDTFGRPLEWLPLEDKQACRVQYRITDAGGLRDQNNWPILQDKLIDAMIQFSAALQPLINNLYL